MTAVSLSEIADELESSEAWGFADQLRALERAYDAPRRVVLTADDLNALRSGRASVERDGVAVFYD